VAAVAVDGAPDRLERYEECSTGVRIGLGAESPKDGEPVEDLLTDPDRRCGVAISPIQGGPTARLRPVDR